MSRRPDYTRKLVVVGDGGCGKTCLLTVYAQGRFPQEYVPTVFENTSKTVAIPTDASKTLEWSLWDTAGQEDFDRIRPLSYQGVEVVLVVFAVNYRTSLGNVADKWHPEISHFTPQTPLLLIGTKIDTRHNPTELSLMRTQGLSPITPEEGAQVAREIGAKGYFECSAMTGEGVERVFEEAWRVCSRTGGLKRRGEGERRKCVVL